MGVDYIAGNGDEALEMELTHREGVQTGQRSHPEGSVSSQGTVDLAPPFAVIDFGKTTSFSL